MKNGEILRLCSDSFWIFEFDEQVVASGKAEPLRVMISGAPASGKGTQCELITQKVCYTYTPLVFTLSFCLFILWFRSFGALFVGVVVFEMNNNNNLAEILEDVGKETNLGAV